MANEWLKKALKCACPAVLAIWLLFTGRGVEAQSSGMAIYLDWPNEGETFYAGPSSLLYSVYIKGYIRPPVGVDPESISIRLNITSPSNPDIVLQEQAGADSRFHFDLTVNPGGSDGQFPAEFADCSAYCHVPSEAALPAGLITLELEASDPTTGQTASIVRHVTVDRSDIARVPVNVHLADDPDHPIEGVSVNAETWIYLWRARHFAAASDADGQALLKIEALTQAPTHYRLSIKPSIVDGFLYEGLEGKTIDLPPGATLAQPISLAVTARQGRIDGSLQTSQGTGIAGATLYAIQLPAGYSMQTNSSESGRFTFDPLPIGRYLVTIDPAYLLDQGAKLEPEEVDLTATIDSKMILTAKPVKGAYATGSVGDSGGTPLPFAWLTVDGGRQLAFQRPDDSTYTMMDLELEPVTLLAASPGYYSQARRIEPIRETFTGTDFTLVPQPETIFEPWGDGFVVLPAASDISMSDGAIRLTSGWLWGETTEEEPLTIQAAGIDVALSSGRFGLEYLPGHQAWFYLLDGQAQVRSHGTDEAIMVQANQMVNLMNGSTLHAVSLEPAVVAALHDQTDEPPAHTWEPTLGALIRDRLSRVGVGTAQVITFITYFLVILGILAAPVFVVYWWLKRRKAALTP